MGTTAEKLQAIVNSKNAIKNTINNFGNIITDSTPLDEYASSVQSAVDSIIDKTITKFKSNTTATISDYLFLNCTSLVSVDLPNTTKIGIASFYGCTALTNIDLPSVTMAGANAFYNCSSLVTASFGENCTSLNSSIFVNCSSLTSVTLKYNGVVSLGSAASFNGCTFPVTIYVPSSLIASYQTATNWSTLYNNNRVTFVAIPE